MQTGTGAVSSQAARMIGPIPKSVYGTSSLKYTWGEIGGFIDVKSGTNYEVQTGFKVFDASQNLLSAEDGAPFTVSWEDANSYAAGLTATVAAVTLLIAEMF